jgi:ABC-type transport system involved in multi-copper enzyme maturation permease subunit
MRQLWTIALNGFRESRRNRVTVVVFAFALVLVLSATFALELTVTTFQRVMTDIGLGSMSFIAVFLTIFLCSGLLPKEIERRTIFMVLTKPISRSTFLVGRLLGNVLTVAFVLGIMSALFFTQVLLDGQSIHQSQVAAIIGLFFEVVLLSALAFAFASVSSQMVASVSVVGLYFIGHMSTDLYRLANRAESELLRVVGKGLYYLLPNLDRLDFKGRATYLDPTPWSEVALSGAYALTYATVMAAVACALFNRRDFR